MESGDEKFRLGFNSYFTLLELAILDPDRYSSYLKNLNLGQSFIFFGVNASLWLVLSSIIRTFLIGKSNLFFGISSEILILLLPISVLLFIFSCALFFLARILGSRAKFKNNFKAVLFSTILLPFLAVPIFKILAAIISLFLLIYCIKRANRFDKIKAVVLVIVPVGISVFVLFLAGVINTNLIIR